MIGVGGTAATLSSQIVDARLSLHASVIRKRPIPYKQLVVVREMRDQLGFPTGSVGCSVDS